jgi:bacterioferritin-associated ferredoxin
MAPSYVIDRCMCEQKTFAALASQAASEHLDLKALSQKTGCGTHCGWCVAYLRRTLATGQTVFHELLPKEQI